MKRGLMLVFGCLVTVMGCQADDGERWEVTRQMVEEAMAEARQGNRRKLKELVERGEKAKFPQSLFSVLVRLLEDPDPLVQCLGTRGLCLLKRRESRGPLTRYLQQKDFRLWEQQVQTGKISEEDYTWHVMAGVFAVMALGEVGDESTIPLLESLRGIKDLEKGNAVEHALVKLGGGLANGAYRLRPNAKQSEISAFRKAVRSIRDPEKVPVLIATVRNPASHGVRDVALEALADILETKALPFVMQVAKDTNYPAYLRDTAITVARRIDPQEAARVAKWALDTAVDEEMRCYALYAMTLVDPEQYVEQAIRFVVDTSITPERRLFFAKRFNLYVDDAVVIKNIVRKYTAQFETWLRAEIKDGIPADGIRYEAWELINSATGAEPCVEFSKRNTHAADALHDRIRNQLEAANYRRLHRRPDEEIQQEIENKYRRLVRFAEERSEEP